MEGLGNKNGGGRGIRTPDDREAITDFKSAGFNHSPIPPEGQTFLEGFPGGLKPFRRSVRLEEGFAGRRRGFFPAFCGGRNGFQHHFLHLWRVVRDY